MRGDYPIEDDYQCDCCCSIHGTSMPCDIYMCPYNWDTVIPYKHYYDALHKRYVKGWKTEDYHK